MSKITIMSEYADVIVMIDHLLTPGHEVQRLEHTVAVDSTPMSIPDLAIVPIFRRPDAIARPIEDFDRDVAGARTLRALGPLMENKGRPLIVFGIGVSHHDVPDDILYHTYLTFPQAIQELNPLISALVGPVERPTAQA